jgi:hypothetical protein
LLVVDVVSAFVGFAKHLVGVHLEAQQCRVGKARGLMLVVGEVGQLVLLSGIASLGREGEDLGSLR